MGALGDGGQILHSVGKETLHVLTCASLCCRLGEGRRLDSDSGKDGHVSHLQQLLGLLAPPALVLFLHQEGPHLPIPPQCLKGFSTELWNGLGGKGP